MVGIILLTMSSYVVNYMMTMLLFHNLERRQMRS